MTVNQEFKFDSCAPSRNFNPYFDLRFAEFANIYSNWTLVLVVIILPQSDSQ